MLYEGTAPAGRYNATAFIGALRDISDDLHLPATDTAFEHRIAPLLGYRLLQASISLPAGDPLHRLVHAFHRTTMHTAGLLRVAETVLGEFQTAGIAALLHKGIHLAHSVYPDPGCRSMGDIDMLVHPKDFARAIETLLRAGWRSEDRPGYAAKRLIGPLGIIRGYHYRRSRGVRAWMLSRPLESGTRAYLDLHRWLVDPGWLPATCDTFWENARNNEPTMEAELIWTLLHAVKAAATGFVPLLHTVDAWWIADSGGISGQHLLNATRRRGCADIVADMASFLENPSPESFPPRIYARSARNDALVRLLAHSRAQDAAYISYAQKIAPQLLMNAKMPRVLTAGLKVLLDRLVWRY